MTASPTLETKNIEYVLDTAEQVLNSSKERRAGSVGEEQAQHIFMNELKKFCDETHEEQFRTHPGAGTLAEKVLCALLIVCVILFYSAVNTGSVFKASISLLTSLVIFCIFSYKFIFDGTKLDFITPAKMSKNLLGIRYSRGETLNRVVLVARSDAPQSMRAHLNGNKSPFILSVCSLIGNTILFSSGLFFLFSGAPQQTGFFSFLSIVCFGFIPFYVMSIFLINTHKVASGISSSIIPSTILLSVMKQLHDNSFRYEKTEVCCLIAGSEYSSRAGAYNFAKRHKRLYTDIPTVFIPLEEITTSRKLAVFFKDGSGTIGSSEVASVIGEAAENLNIDIQKETSLLGSSSYTPFSKNDFPACSLGTSKKHTSKTISANADTLQTVSKKAIFDVGGLVIETLNYYDG